MQFIGVVGEKAGSRIFTENFYNNAKEPNELVEIKGASHVDLYDKVDFIEQAVDKIDTFFKKTCLMKYEHSLSVNAIDLQQKETRSFNFGA